VLRGRGGRDELRSRGAVAIFATTGDFAAAPSEAGGTAEVRAEAFGPGATDALGFTDELDVTVLLDVAAGRLDTSMEAVDDVRAGGTLLFGAVG
jgi:hypothetical protein